MRTNTHTSRPIRIVAGATSSVALSSGDVELADATLGEFADDTSDFRCVVVPVFEGALLVAGAGASGGYLAIGRVLDGDA